MDIHTIIGNNIALRRKLLSLSPETMAANLAITPIQLAFYEEGQEAVAEPLLALMAQLLHTTPDKLREADMITLHEKRYTLSDKQLGQLKAIQYYFITARCEELQERICDMVRVMAQGAQGY